LSIDVLSHSGAGASKSTAAERERDEDRRQREETPPVVYSSPVHSPSKIAFGQGQDRTGEKHGAEGVEDMMQDISLDDASAGAGLQDEDGGPVGSPTTPTASKRPVAA
jgi:hypothetical protein